MIRTEVESEVYHNGFGHELYFHPTAVGRVSNGWTTLTDPNRHRLLHRNDGPAVINGHAFKFWYLMGHQYRFNDWLQSVDRLPAEKVLLKMQYG